MALEKYIAAASLGLFIMFVGEMITIYDFMIEPQREVEPSPKILQFISIGAAPALVLTGTSFLIAKRYGSKPAGAMIIAGGIVLLIGMVITNILIENIEEKYLDLAVTLTPPLFMGISIPVILVGVILLRMKKKKPKKEYF